MKNNKFLIVSAFIILFLFFCKGDPNVPGETKENPLSFNASDFASGKLKVKKTYLEIKGIPLTALYSYTYKKKEFNPSTPTEEKAKAFYFPIVPKGYSYQNDKITIFVHATPSEFKTLTNEFKEYIDLNSDEKVVVGRRKAFFKVPQVILNAYTKPQGGNAISFKVADPKKILTIDFDSIK